MLLCQFSRPSLTVFSFACCWHCSFFIGPGRPIPWLFSFTGPLGSRPWLLVFLHGPLDICSSNLLVTPWLGARTGCANFSCHFSQRSLLPHLSSALPRAIWAVVEVSATGASEAFLCASGSRLCISLSGSRRRSKRNPGPLLLPIAVSLVVVPAFLVALYSVLGLAWLCMVFCCTHRCPLICSQGFGAWSCHSKRNDWYHVFPVFPDLPVLMKSPPTLSCARRASVRASPL